MTTVSVQRFILSCLIVDDVLFQGFGSSWFGLVYWLGILAVSLLIGGVEVP